MPASCKNEEIILDITALSHQGEGIGRYNGMAVFVPMAAVGDRLRVRIVKVLKHMAYGIIREVVSPSESRVKNDCPVFNSCGGCALRHISYEEELRCKEGFVRDNLLRIGKIETEFLPILPSHETGRYRNKAQYPVRLMDGRVKAGFFAPRSHRLIPVEDCLLQPAFFGDLCRILCDFMEKYDIPPYDENDHTGLVRHFYLRHASKTGQLMASVVINGKELPHWQVLLGRLQTCYTGFTTLVLDTNMQKTNVISGGHQTVLSGPGSIVDQICNIEVELSPASFYQVNRDAAEELYRQAAEFAGLRKTDLLLDLYCGAGAIGLSMAHLAGEVIGVEIVPQAVENARANAGRNGIRNARFFCADAGEAARRLGDGGIYPDVVLLDPPRKGADEATLAAIISMKPEKIIYISCNSATLARDCARLSQDGYRVVKARPADLFPRTPHVECVCLLMKDV